MRVLRELVQDTLKRSNLDITLSHQIVTALTISGISSIVDDVEVTKIEASVQRQAAIAKSIHNPLKVTANFNASNSMLCPYCKTIMQKLKIKGDLIKEAGFCVQDRITLPFVKQ